MARPPDLPAEDGNGNLEAITAGGPGLVAVGQDLALKGSTKLVAAVWVSSDGRTWSRVPHTVELEGAGHTYMWDVTANEDMIVAVGVDVGIGPVDTGREVEDAGAEDKRVTRAAVWNSSDGLTWARITPDAAVFQDGNIFSIVRYGSGFVAVGSVCEGSDGCQHRAAAWVSGDGQTWTRSLIGDTDLFAVATWDRGLIAVGPHVWTSVDGSTWTEFATPFNATVLGDSQLTDVVDVGAGVLVVGRGASVPVVDPNDPNDIGYTTPLAWFTEDGTTWTDLSSALPGDMSLLSVEATASQVFAVTRGCTVGQPTCGLWVWGAPPQ